MIRHLILYTFALVSMIHTYAQITGNTTPTEGLINYDYTFESDFVQLGGVTWHVTGGTVTGTSGPSGTEYYATIQFSTPGSQTITVKNGYSGNTVATLNVTVQEELDAGEIGNAQTICYDEDPSALTNVSSASGGTGTYAYQWQHKPSGGSWSDISGATSTTYNPSSLTVTTQFKRKVFSGLTKYSNTITITVHDELDAGSIGTDQTICYGETPTTLTNETAASGGDGSWSYQWQSKPSGGSWSNISGATTTAYSPSNLTTTTQYRRRVTSCGSTENSNAITVTVHPELLAGSIGNDQSIIFNTAPDTIKSLVSASGGDGSYSYKWEKRELDGDWTFIPLQSGEFYVDTTSLTTETQYRRYVVSCSDTTYSDTVTVSFLYPELIVGQVGGDQTICYNGTAQTLTLPSGPSGGDSTAYSYQWQSTCPIDGCPFSDIAGATSVSYTPDTIKYVRHFRLKVTSGGQTVYSNEVKITPLQGTGFAGYITGPTDVIGSTNSGTLTLGTSSDYITWYSSTDDGDTWTELTTTDETYDFSNLSEDTYFRAELEANECISHSDPYLVRVLPDDSSFLDIVPVNYTKSTTLLVEEEDVEDVGSLPLSQKSVTYTYFDGLGRQVQQVLKGASPDGDDIVSFKTYDALMLTDTSYLPYVTSGDDYYENAISSQATYYGNGTLEGVELSTAAYAVTNYSASPLKQVLEQGAPGSAWQPGGGHTITHDYRFNTTADTVPRYGDESLSDLGDYPPATLIRIETADENGHKVITYQDSKGLTILKQVEQSTGNYASTVHVYDILGKLRFVLPPNATQYIIDNAATWNLTKLRDEEDLIFEYRYDEKGRLTERKVPGKGWEYLVYDPLDRVALTQDAIMRVRDQWAFTKMDRLGRALYSGLYENDSTRAELQAAFDALDYEGGSDPFYEAPDTTLQGYSNTVYPTQNLEVHSVNYYDDYDFDRDGTSDYAFNDNHYSGQDTVTIGQTSLLPTGSKTRILETNDWLIAVNFYNEDGQPIQSLSNNHTNLTVNSITTNIYADFTGELQKSGTTIRSGVDTTDIRKEYTYDNRKRLTRTRHKLNDEDWVTLHDLDYNELGQLIEKDIGGAVQSIDYTYNIRGWLTGINETEESDDVFGMSLVYQESDGDLGNTAQYNGNISGVKWSAYDTEGEGITARGYAYSYDHSDRLVGADHMKKQTSWGSTSGYDVSGTQYDANGNMQQITRKNKAGVNLDTLNYTYHGNQLMQVSDQADSLGFVDGNTSGDDYAYDVNGNLIRDLNKKIDTIYYNHLDLPVKIVISDTTKADSLTYMYSAAGSKLRMIAWQDGDTLTWVDYVGGMRFEKDTLRSMMHEEGRIVMSPFGGGQGEDYDYQYYLTDHQGNTRRVLSTRPEVFETTATMEDANSTDEEAVFLNLSSTRVSYSSANHTAGGSKVAQLNSNNSIGPSVVLKVDKGDTLSLSAYAYFEGGSGYSSAIAAATLESALESTFNTAAGLEAFNSTVIDDGIGEAITVLGVGGSSDDEVPGAYLNYILFTDSMSYVSAGFVQISDAADYGQELVELNDIVMSQSGYVLAYVSNESNSANYVYFDDFTIRHAKTNVVQAVDYYPFGLEAMTYTRTAADPTKYLYNGGVEKNDYTSYYETFYRNYDASIGRFMGVDIKAGKYASVSPYVYAMNDPVYWNDPYGDEISAEQIIKILETLWAQTHEDGSQGSVGGYWHSSTADQIGLFGNEYTALAFGANHNDLNDSWSNTHVGSYGRAVSHLRDIQFWRDRAPVSRYTGGPQLANVGISSSLSPLSGGSGATALPSSVSLNMETGAQANGSGEQLEPWIKVHSLRSNSPYNNEFGYFIDASTYHDGKYEKINWILAPSIDKQVFDYTRSPGSIHSNHPFFYPDYNKPNFRFWEHYDANKHGMVDVWLSAHGYDGNKWEIIGTITFQIKYSDEYGSDIPYQIKYH